MTERHCNIPVFIPHLGCPNQCVFCNQRSISGSQVFREEDVKRQIDEALTTVGAERKVEIAFFGGSFTGIDRGLMLRLLELAEGYVRAGRVDSIRLSTRPDYISDEILRILSGYSVRTVELGLQSMEERVLRSSGRGHTAEDAARACRAVVDAGFLLTGQMMIGLPDSTPQSEIETAEKICALGATSVRIYPTVVFYDTPLCEMAQSGAYTPLTLAEAVVRSAAVLRVFEAHGVPCIRIGLCATDALTSPQAVYAGPNHPALGELVWSELRYEMLLEAVTLAGACGKRVTLRVPEREVSRVVGQHRCNLTRLLEACGTRVAKVIGSPLVDRIEVIEIER
ncbi:MAG: radical SAM protein [Clostridia bacterium]|nr:radical SAM protein [Clostridia bacterium]